MASAPPLAQAPPAQAPSSSNPMDPAFILARLKAALQRGVDTSIDLTTRARYGVSPTEKDRLTYARELPGAPPYTQDPTAAERYSSAYLGTQKWGPLAAALFNVLALGDAKDALTGQAVPVLQRKATGMRAIGAAMDQT